MNTENRGGKASRRNLAEQRPGYLGEVANAGLNSRQLATLESHIKKVLGADVDTDIGEVATVFTAIHRQRERGFDVANDDHDQELLAAQRKAKQNSDRMRRRVVLFGGLGTAVAITGPAVYRQFFAPDVIRERAEEEQRKKQQEAQRKLASMHEFEKTRRIEPETDVKSTAGWKIRSLTPREKLSIVRANETPIFYEFGQFIQFDIRNPARVILDAFASDTSLFSSQIATDIEVIPYRNSSGVIEPCFRIVYKWKSSSHTIENIELSQDWLLPLNDPYVMFESGKGDQRGVLMKVNPQDSKYVEVTPLKTQK